MLLVRNRILFGVFVYYLDFLSVLDLRVDRRNSDLATYILRDFRLFCLWVHVTSFWFEKPGFIWDSMCTTALLFLLILNECKFSGRELSPLKFPKMLLYCIAGDCIRLVFSSLLCIILLLPLPLLLKLPIAFMDLSILVAPPFDDPIGTWYSRD